MSIDFKYVITRAPQNNMQQCAPGKAPSDCAKILEKKGYKNILFKMPCGSAIKKGVSTLIQIIKIRRIIGNHSSVVVQYPIAPYFVWAISFLRNLNITILIHDIETIRAKGVIGKDDVRSFSLANKVIVHSEGMSHILQKNNISTTQIRILNYFDYLSNEHNLEDRCLSNTVCFCGNLNKSKELINKFSTQQNVSFNLYGAQKVNNSQNISYMGSFSPDNIAHIKGSWGLVWDGSSLDGCEGLLGEYLKINAPHKQSLYLAAEMPLIVWSQSPSAAWVKKKKLGIAVDSLTNLAEELAQVTPPEYEVMKKNVASISQVLRQGGNLSSVIEM